VLEKLSFLRFAHLEKDEGARYTKLKSKPLWEFCQYSREARGGIAEKPGKVAAMFTPRAVFQELCKGHCYTIYQDPPTGQYYLMIDEVVYTESGETFKADIPAVFSKLTNLKQRLEAGKRSCH
jgi:cation transport regulator ChaC